MPRIEPRSVQPTTHCTCGSQSHHVAKLHVTIQQAIGWLGCHLHEFIIAPTHYGELDPRFTLSQISIAENAYAQTRRWAYVANSITSTTTGDNRARRIRPIEVTSPQRPAGLALVSGWSQPVSARGCGPGSPSIWSSCKPWPIPPIPSTPRCGIDMATTSIQPLSFCEWSMNGSCRSGFKATRCWFGHYQ